MAEESCIKQYEEQLSTASASLDKMENDFETLLKSGNFGGDADLEKLILENSKLINRIQHMKKAIAEEEQTFATHSPDVLRALVQAFTVAIFKAFPQLHKSKGPAIAVAVSRPPKDNFGDYQCTSAMSIAQLLRQAAGAAAGNQKPAVVNPKEVAELIISKLPDIGLIEKTEVSGPGFINIRIRKDFIAGVVNRMLLGGISPPPMNEKLKIVIDYSSPNVAKEMHVGHLRSTIIGNALYRLLTFVGHDVVGINHIGDWGTQFGMLIAHLHDAYPSYLTNPPELTELQNFYKASKKRFDEDAEFKARAYEAVVKLQKHEPDHIAAWKLICDISEKAYHRIYERLDVQDLETRGESTYQEPMVAMVDYLKKHKLLVEEDGRQLLFADGAPVPLTIVKSDGGFTYDTSDMAALKYRTDHDKADWILYVVDNGQSVHFQSLFAAAQKADLYNPTQKRLEHIGFGVVLDEQKKKFKSRSGDTVKLSELLDEGQKRSMDKLLEKGRDKELSADELQAACDAVAYGCIKYADLRTCRTSDYVFSFDRMLDDRGNTAVYLLYAYTRIRSIARVAGMAPGKIREAVANGTATVSVEHAAEFRLAKVLARFGEVIRQATVDLYIHPLCDLAYDIATAFTEFYDNCYCVRKDETGAVVEVNVGRLALCEVTANVLAAIFSIVGLRTVSRM